MLGLHEVETDMSGQSNHCLRVCNVKMKKNYRGRNAPHVHEFFFDEPLHVLCLGWEVKTHISGQSNDCLRVCNVKMKKNSTGVEMGHISKHVWVMGPIASSDLNQFFSKMVKLDEEEC